MKKKSFISFIILAIVCLLISCAELVFIPKGSKSLGVYEGSFSGNMYEGTLRIELFQTPKGNKLFEGTFYRNTAYPDARKVFFVQGNMKSSSLEGTMQADFSGTLTGKISSDGNRLTGSYNITQPDLDTGTWRAQKK